MVRNILVYCTIGWCPRLNRCPPVRVYARSLVGYALLGCVHPSIHWDDGKTGTHTAAVIERHGYWQ